MAAIVSISTLMPLMKDKNHFLIWRHFPVVARWIRQPQLSEISVLQKQHI